MTAQNLNAEAGRASEAERSRSLTGDLAYLFAGLLFGLVLVKSEAASWYRIQEMFRFQSFHMYGLLGSAVLTGLLSTALLRRAGHTRAGEAVKVSAKDPGWRRYVFGGATFGLGWGLSGLCPGPIFVQLGAGIGGAAVVLLFALVGTYLYGVFKDRLPH